MPQERSGPGEIGELIIGGVGLARYLDPVKDAEKFAPMPSLGWERAYRQRRPGPQRPQRSAVPGPRRRAGQARRPPDRAGRGRRRAPGPSAGSPAPPPRSATAPPATSCWSGTSYPKTRPRSTRPRRPRLREELPAALVPAAGRRRHAADQDLGQGRPQRTAVAAAAGWRGDGAGEPSSAADQPGWPSTGPKVLGAKVAGSTPTSSCTAAAAWPPPSWCRGCASGTRR